MKNEISLIVIFILVNSIGLLGQQVNLKSAGFDWNKIPIEKKETGEKRLFFIGKTSTLDYLSVHVTSLKPGCAPHDSHFHADKEELMIVKEGELTVTLNGKKDTLRAGSVIFSAIGDRHGFINHSDSIASYYIVQWSRLNVNNPQKINSQMVSYDTIHYKKTKKGGQSILIKKKTKFLHQLQVHYTIANKDSSAYKLSWHNNEELMIVFEGEVEEKIGTKTTGQLGPGSVIFLSSGDKHEIHGVSQKPARYMAIKLAVEPEIKESEPSIKIDINKTLPVQ